MAAFPEQGQEGRLGRMPVWLIGVILAGVFILIWAIRRHFRPKEVSVTGAEDSVDGIPSASFADQISGNFPAYTPTAPAAADKPVTNSQWLKLAFDYLVGFGKDPAMVQSALQKYLSGAALSPGEQSLVSQALANSSISLPPEGVTLPQTSDPTSTPTTDTPEYVDAPIESNLYNFADQYPYLGVDTGRRFVKLFGSVKGDPSALNPTARNYMRWDPGSPNKIPVFDQKYAGRVPKIRVK
jgi:hypothetical protein